MKNNDWYHTLRRRSAAINGLTFYKFRWCVFWGSMIFNVLMASLNFILIGNIKYYWA